MKTSITLGLMSLATLLACTKISDSLDSASVTMPFKATYTGQNKSSEGSSSGNLPYFARISEYANGFGTLVGSSTFHSEIILKAGIIYTVKSFIISENGDTLFLMYSGKSCMALTENEKLNDNDHPDEIFCWNIPFTILGGTGGFEGVTGQGMTNDFLSNVGNTYYHSWSGIINIPREHFKELQYSD